MVPSIEQGIDRQFAPVGARCSTHGVQRAIEPELMRDRQQALAYARADFSEPNAAFLHSAEWVLTGLGPSSRVVDLGCGPADIPIRLALAHPEWQLDALDGSPAMIALAREAASCAGVSRRLHLHCARLQHSPLPSFAYDAVLSNSLLHHLHEPQLLWQQVVRLGRPGASVMVADLRRPGDQETARRIVSRYSGNEPPILKRDFFRSLLAAFTVPEVRLQLDQAGLVELKVEPTDDRHLLVSGRLR